MNEPNSGVYVQYGCGLSSPDGWINFDASPRLRVERLPVVSNLSSALNKQLFPSNVTYGNIVKGLPVEDASVDGIYASHVLEHLSHNHLMPSLKNTRKALKPGGIFRLIVPDLTWRAEIYLESVKNQQIDAADAFMLSCYLGEPVASMGLMARLRDAIGNSAHKWMYNEQSMTKALEDAGFVNIRTCEMGDSQDKMFDSVEDELRFFDSGQKELAMHAERPS